MKIFQTVLRRGKEVGGTTAALGQISTASTSRKIKDLGQELNGGISNATLGLSRKLR